MKILEYSWNYMLPILVPCSAKRIETQILVIEKLSGKNFFCDIILCSKELPVQS